MRTQLQMHEIARRKDADLNSAFMEMIKSSNPITWEELVILIERRPVVYGRFSNWVSVLARLELAQIKRDATTAAEIRMSFSTA